MSNLDGKTKNHIRGFCTTGLFLTDIFAEFSRELRLKEYSKNTIRAYCFHVDNFLESVRIPARQISESDVKHYICSLYNESRYSLNTIRIKIRALRVFYRYLHETGRILCNPAEKLTEPAMKSRLPNHVMSARDMERIRGSITGESLLKLRDRAIIEVLYSTGLRLSELAGLDIRDLNLNENLVNVRHGKGDRDRQTVLNTSAEKALSEYLNKRLESPGDPNALWINRFGKRLSKYWIWKMIRRAAYTARVISPAHPHAWRHGIATELIRRGASLITVQRFLGHLSPSTTIIYTHLTVTDLKHIHRQTHPREKDGHTAPVPPTFFHSRPYAGSH